MSCSQSSGKILQIKVLSKIIKPCLELFEGDFAVIAFFSLCTGGFAELFEFFLRNELCSLSRIHTAVSRDICLVDSIVFMDNIKGFKCTNFATRFSFAGHNSFAVFAIDTTTGDEVFTVTFTRLKLNLGCNIKDGFVECNEWISNNKKEAYIIIN